jgi:uncharacterized damage-inducible protein DinB
MMASTDAASGGVAAGLRGAVWALAVAAPIRSTTIAIRNLDIGPSAVLARRYHAPGSEEDRMKMTDFFSAQLEREAVGTRRALERVPDGRADWKPHEKSMPFGYLSSLVAMIPSWIAMMVEREELDLNPPGGSAPRAPAPGNNRELLALFDDSLAKARHALANASDENLEKPWRLLVAGNVVAENPRHVMIADTFGHLAHHRGQLTVYLRLLGAPVPAIYGPSADDRSFS